MTSILVCLNLIIKIKTAIYHCCKLQQFSYLIIIIICIITLKHAEHLYPTYIQYFYFTFNIFIISFLNNHEPCAGPLQTSIW